MKKKSTPPKSLHELLDRLQEAGEGKEEVSVDAMMDAVGHKSFAPPLLLVGVALTAPGLADIPGVSTLLGLFRPAGERVAVVGPRALLADQWLLKREI